MRHYPLRFDPGGLWDYRPGPGAVDPPGIGEGISLAEPCVFVAFRRGVVLTAPVVPVVVVVPVVPVVPVC
ncbi:MAG: hypothetical protein ACJ8LL_03470 [Candidatus Udaeobacter sp.]